MRLPKLAPILALTLLLSGSVVSAHAQEVSMVVSPPRYDISMNPGETVQKTVKITNNVGDKDLILNVFAVDFIVQDDKGTPIKVSENASGRFLASPWFIIDKNELVVPPGQDKMVSVLITAPKDALPGGHYAGIFFQPVETRGQKTTISYTAAQVGSLFAITIAGDIKYDAIIKDFKTTKSQYEFGPVDFQAVVENQSDTHIRPQASITIKDMFGRKLTDLPLEEVNIFPFTSRTMTGSWDQIWGLGRYSATLTAAYGPGMSMERTLFFWIMPWKIIAAIGVVLLVIIVLVITVRRHIKHRQDTRDSEIDDLKRKVVELENRQ